MTDSTMPAPALLAWAGKELGVRVSVTTDTPRPRRTARANSGENSRGNPRVWVLRRPDGALFHLKVSPQPLAYERETLALRHAVPALGAGRAPQLRASNAAHLALLLTTVQGRPLRHPAVSPAEEVQAHRQGGALLARLHEAGDLSGPRRTEAERALWTAADGAAPLLRRAADRITAAEHGYVRDLTERLRVLPPLPLAFIHGAARPRNLLWSRSTEQAGWIGFERARFAPAVQDFVRMSCGIWADRPDLRAACFQGYGRGLVPEERHALKALAALDAVRCLVRGPALADHEVTARGRRTLNRLTAGVFV
ncbi:phosphotransferase [Streptomyces sp. NBC_01176]|uniref:phosphotransferase n=1 Tax=Streptomyces sp. NBC_01176 TaxID=2903760 RepID=UPI00386FDE2D|nr:aminoglycoside phosphotransferase family protein [Streptomyces sp. NBC_01176]